jgi:hypothetical protein
VFGIAGLDSFVHPDTTRAGMSKIQNEFSITRAASMSRWRNRRQDLVANCHGARKEAALQAIGLKRSCIHSTNY